MYKIILFFVLVSMISACVTPSKKVEPINPNGDSELAIVMRNMEAHWAKTKKALESNKTLPKTPNFSNLLTATPTSVDMKMPSYDGFAQAYLIQVKDFEDATSENKTESFNAIVNGCVLCHLNSCSGPIPRIKKLLIK